MKISLTTMDMVLIALWSLLLVNSAGIASHDLLFGWPIQVHLAITGTLLAAKIVGKKFLSRN